MHLYHHLQHEAATISIWGEQMQVAIALKKIINKERNKTQGEMESLGLNTAHTGFL